MRRRPVVIILMLVMPLILALPLWAQQKLVAPTLRSARADVAASLPRHGGIKPPLRRQKYVGPSSAGPRPNAVRPYVACAAALKPGGPNSADLKVSATTVAGTNSGLAASPAKPFTQELVVSMVRDGFGDESGAKLIEQRGIDVTPSEDFIQTRKAAGGSEAFLNALRAAKPPEPAIRIVRSQVVW